jgi:chloramphenicol-sensitive protein RarD
MVFLAVIITLTGNWQLVRKATSHIGALTLSAVLIATNWLIFIWAIGNDRMVESSLGYFISPMVSVMLGLIFLSERLRPGQWWAISLAVIGILVQLLAYGKFPWVALSLALSFGVYGLIRKRVEVPSIAGLMLETSILAPIALAYLCYLGWRHDLVFMSQGPGMDLLLMCAGIITTLPLLGFASAVIRLSLVTLGLLQYVAPTIMLAVAVLFYGEPFTTAHLVSFAIIWSALAIFSGESYLFVRKGAEYVKI